MIGKRDALTTLFCALTVTACATFASPRAFGDSPRAPAAPLPTSRALPLTLETESVAAPLFAELAVGSSVFQEHLGRAMARTGVSLGGGSWQEPLRHIQAVTGLSIAEVVDVSDETVVNLQSSVLRFVLPRQNVQPYLAFVRQTNDYDDTLRYGVGGGVRWMIAPGLSIGGEVLNFGSAAQEFSRAGRGAETLFMGRLELSF